jgi:hypothetical protein
MLLPATFKKIKSNLNTVAHSDYAASGGGRSGGISNGHKHDRRKKRKLNQGNG